MSHKILIVEDEPIIASDIESILSSNGYFVVGIAYNSVQALDMLSSRHPDLAILDISIKGDRNGIEIASIIREKYKLPFIFLTSFSDKDTVSKAGSTMPYGYVVKPFKDRDIITALELAIQRSELENHPNPWQISMHLDKNLNPTLTKMEKIVIEKIWEGKNNQAIADELYLSLPTIKSHTRHIFQKLGVKSRSELMVLLRS